MWKFHDFSVTQNLREVNFGESRSSKTAVLAILGALKMIDLANLAFRKCKICRFALKALNCDFF